MICSFKKECLGCLTFTGSFTMYVNHQAPMRYSPAAKEPCLGPFSMRLQLLRNELSPLLDSSQEDVASLPNHQTKREPTPCRCRLLIVAAKAWTKATHDETLYNYVHTEVAFIFGERPLRGKHHLGQGWQRLSITMSFGLDADTLKDTRKIYLGCFRRWI